MIGPAPAVADIIFGTEPSGEELLFVTAVLLWLGYLGVRLSGRFRVPVVTSFLLLGVVAGPSGLNFISAPVIDALGVVEPVALGLITFSAGEMLLFRDLTVLQRRHVLAITLEAILPTVAVGLAVYALTGEAVISLVLGTIAGTTGIATVMATLKEHNARGDFTRLLSVAIASDNVLAILAFSLLLPLAVALERSGGALELYLESFAGIVVALLVGVLAGTTMGRFIGRIRSSSELSMFVLSHLLVAVGVAYLLDYSVLLTGLATGIVAVNTCGGDRERQRLFTSLSALEAPLIAVFFLWAGAGLHLRALLEVGVLALVYVVARAVGKAGGPFLANLLTPGPSDGRLRGMGLGLMPQAGAAIGLAITAREVLPVSGNEVLTVVLASVVVFELTGPLAVARAVKQAGETAPPPASDEPITLPEALATLQERKGVLMVVTDRTTTLWQLASVIRLADGLQADLAVLPVEEPSGSRWRGPPADNLLGREPVDLLRSHAESHEHAITVLEAVVEDIPARVMGAAEEVNADLLILAWSPYHRRRLAPLVVDQSTRPVVELPGQKSTQGRGLDGVAQSAGRTVVERATAPFRRLLGRRSRGAGARGERPENRASEGTDS